MPAYVKQKLKGLPVSGDASGRPSEPQTPSSSRTVNPPGPLTDEAHDRESTSTDSGAPNDRESAVGAPEIKLTYDGPTAEIEQAAKDLNVSLANYPRLKKEGIHIGKLGNVPDVDAVLREVKRRLAMNDIELSKGTNEYVS